MPRHQSITSQVIGRRIRVGYCARMAQQLRGVGEHLREWRLRRRLSQLDLALEADISTRHLSFLETGRAQPSRDMLLHLAEQLDVPLRERNVLLAAAGYAAVFRERSLEDPALAAARTAIDLVLAGHEPFPAIAVDRHWRLVSANKAVGLLLAGVDQDLLRQPVNVLRVALHPNGLAPRTVNLAEWRAHLLARLRRQIELTADPDLIELLNELQKYPAARSAKAPSSVPPGAAVVLPLQLQTEHGILSLISTVTVFGTPIDVTVAELALECFYPADGATTDILQRAAAIRRASQARSGTADC
jgi:transcriptional regulator with XRE-family HTH domain